VDAGTAKLLADLGFEAIATSSAALAWTMARPDAAAQCRRDVAIAHAGLLHEATGLPVNGDFESGYGDTPAEVAETVRRAIDAAWRAARSRTRTRVHGGLYPPDEALRRFSAAKEAVLRSGSDFVLTGRCEVFFHRHPEPLKEAVRRLQIYAAAGADVVYAPGVTQEAEISEIVAAVSVPVNVLGGLGGVSNDPREAGAARSQARFDRLGSRQGRAGRVSPLRPGSGRPPLRVCRGHFLKHPERRLRCTTGRGGRGCLTAVLRIGRRVRFRPERLWKAAGAAWRSLIHSATAIRFTKRPPRRAPKSGSATCSRRRRQAAPSSTPGLSTPRRAQIRYSMASPTGQRVERRDGRR
jgi:hypothetical protein